MAKVKPTRFLVETGRFLLFLVVSYKSFSRVFLLGSQPGIRRDYSLPAKVPVTG